VGSCDKAKDMAADNVVKEAFEKTMANRTGLPEKNVECKLSHKCTRRLQAELFDSIRRKLSAGSLEAVLDITVPPGKTADQVKTSVLNTNENDFGNVLKSNLKTTKFENETLTVQSISAPVATTSVAGYKCKQGEACYFGNYLKDTHFTINSTDPVTLSECRQRCNNFAGCEAFESNTADPKSTCSFWKAGACNIPGGSPPGYVKNVPNVHTCEKDPASRSKFTPVASKCGRENILGAVSVLIWAFLMSAMTR